MERRIVRFRAAGDRLVLARFPARRVRRNARHRFCERIEDNEPARAVSDVLPRRAHITNGERDRNAGSVHSDPRSTEHLIARRHHVVSPVLPKKRRCRRAIQPFVAICREDNFRRSVVHPLCDDHGTHDTSPLFSYSCELENGFLVSSRHPYIMTDTFLRIFPPTHLRMLGDP